MNEGSPISEQRVAVVCGATRGWGLAVAEGLAADGVAVVVNGRGPEVEAVVERIRARGGSAIGARAATDDPRGVDEVADRTIGAFGRIDIWVNSLGVQRPQSLLALDLRDWNDILRIQLTAVFLGTQRAARHMVDQGGGGRILNIVGGGAYGLAGASAHAASKGGALSASISWAEELSPHGITVNAIRGGVQSPGMRTFMDGVRLLDAAEDASPATLRQLGFYPGEEAAPLAVWLASESAGDVTGFHIGIDGSRVVVYERVSFALEMSETDRWTVDKLEERLHSAMRTLSPQFGSTQRHPSVRSGT